VPGSGLPVLVANDANAALWGEARFGAARGADHVLMVTLGTGIGGALLVAGRLHTGRNGMAGEFGHMRVVPTAVPASAVTRAAGSSTARARHWHGSPAMPGPPPWGRP
jgi:glucokinase